MCIRSGREEHERAKAGVMVGVANRTWPIRAEKRERKWRLGQDQENKKLDIRQTIMASCALDGEGYCIRRGGRT